MIINTLINVFFLFKKKNKSIALRNIA